LTNGSGERLAISGSALFDTGAEIFVCDQSLSIGIREIGGNSKQILGLLVQHSIWLCVDAIRNRIKDDLIDRDGRIERSYRGDRDRGLQGCSVYRTRKADIDPRIDTETV
jgi:hypothetical protein